MAAAMTVAMVLDMAMDMALNIVLDITVFVFMDIGLAMAGCCDCQPFFYRRYYTPGRKNLTTVHDFL